MSLEITEIDDDNAEKAGSEQQEANNIEITPEIQALIEQQAQKIIAEKGTQAAPNSDLSRLVEVLTQSLADNKKDEVYDDLSFNSRKNLDPEDVLDAPVTFYCPKYKYVIGGDRKNGRQTPPPNGPIKFGYMHTIRKMSGKDTFIQQWSKFDCFSKAELDFLQKHSTFGSMFYQKQDALIQTEDMNMINSLMRKMASLKEIESHRVLAMLKENNLPITTQDVSEQKLMLATHLAKEEMKMIKSEFANKVIEDNKAAALLKVK